MATHSTPIALDQGKSLHTQDFDPNVIVPPSVRAAAAAAEAAHLAAYAQPANPEPVADPANPIPVPAAAAPSAPTPNDTAAPAPVDNYTSAPAADELRDPWAQRYNSMRGRWEQEQKKVNSMQGQMNQLADELQRSQALMEQMQPRPANPDHEKLITKEDVDTYGQELLDVTRRAALEAVKPEIDRLAAENQQLKRDVISTKKKDVYAYLGGKVPNWAAINTDQGFLNWLRLPNVYTGEVRKLTLDRAMASANALIVTQVFQDYVNELRATGGVLPGSQGQQQQTDTSGSPDPAPAHQAAMTLENLAAPGRPRPAGGDTAAVLQDKPIYSRKNIADFYANVRRGLYRGREKEQAAIEADLTAAQHEGRIR